MSVDTKLSVPRGYLEPFGSYGKSEMQDFADILQVEENEPEIEGEEVKNEEPLHRQDTSYVDSAYEMPCFESTCSIDKFDTIEGEDFVPCDSEAGERVFRPRTLLEAVDAMVSILDDLGDRYNNWKYCDFGAYRFYCHKYNIANVASSRPYYSKILGQLEHIQNRSLHFLSSHYRPKSDSDVYSSDPLVDRVLCQLDELVSCFCSKNCAFGTSKSAIHVCSDYKIAHSSLRWRVLQSGERYLSVRSFPREKSVLEKGKSADKTGPLDWSRPYNRLHYMDKNLFNKLFSPEAIPQLSSLVDRAPDQGANLPKTEPKVAAESVDETCFLSQVDDGQCVMEFFSERGIMHNFSFPYKPGEQTTFIHPFFRAVVCFNCGKICRCRCQRKIFRAQSSPHTQSDGKSRALENTSMDYVNSILNHTLQRSDISHKHCDSGDKQGYSGHKHGDSGDKQGYSDHKHCGNGCRNSVRALEMNTIYTHSINTRSGRVQFVPNNSRAKSSAVKGVERSEDVRSVYYSNLFKGSECKVDVDDVFRVINNVPFSCVNEALFAHYKTVNWFELYRSPWWCLDRKFEDKEAFEEEGYLNAYVINTLDSLGYLGNVRYDTSLKVVGVGYYRRKSCYWRFFYNNNDIWGVFRDAVEYFILISSLPIDVYLDQKLASFILTKGVVKRFSIYPSLLNAYGQLVHFIKSNANKREYKPLVQKPCSESSVELGKCDYGVEAFDFGRVGSYDCSVADVQAVSLKRKIVTFGGSFTPKRYHLQKSSSVTPTIKLKLSHETIYQGIFSSTPNSSKYSGSKAGELRLNNLNILLSYYPDARTQYSCVVNQANELRFQMSLILSDLNSNQGDFNSDTDVDTVVGDEHNCDETVVSDESVNNEHNCVETVVSGVDEDIVEDLPMFDITFNSSTNSWICLLEVVPCLVCPSECESNGSCLHYTQGKKLIEFICKKMNPTELKFAYPQHSSRSHQGKKSQIGLVSFSVNQYGHERAKLLASQLRATYKIHALNSMLSSVKGEKKDKDVNKKRNERFDTGPEMKLLHNAITTQLSCMISTHSFISPTIQHNDLHNDLLHNNQHNDLLYNGIQDNGGHGERDDKCICERFGKVLIGSGGEVNVSEIQSVGENVELFGRILELGPVMDLRSESLFYCGLHCSFVTTWLDVMGQRRVMFHPIQRYLNLKEFSSYAKSFNLDWPYAIELHNKYTVCYDALEASKLFSQANEAVSEAFYSLTGIQKMLNEAVVSALALAVRTLSDAAQEKALLRRISVIYKRFKLSTQTIRNSLLFSHEIMFPFGALYDEATPPLSEEDF